MPVIKIKQRCRWIPNSQCYQDFVVVEIDGIEFERKVFGPTDGEELATKLKKGFNVD